MNKEILMAVDAVSNEKGVDKEIIFDALEAALASAARKKHGEELDVRVSINRKTGAYDTWRRWKVFADDSTELEVPQRELRLDDARDIDKDVEVGGYVEEPMESVPFGRILAQTAKQVIVQKVREAERAQVVDAYKDRAGTLVSGIVKRVDRNGVYVDLGANAEGYIAREELIPREPVRSQDRIKAFLKDKDAKFKQALRLDDKRKSKLTGLTMAETVKKIEAEKASKGTKIDTESALDDLDALEA